MKSLRRLFTIGSAAFLATSLLLANCIYAKEVTILDTVTVTAQKIEENMQEVPISLTVFDEFSIEDKQIKSVKDIASYTPNLMLFDNSGGGCFSPTMRGIKTRGSALSTSVGMFIDGIPVLNSNGFDEVLMDVERIEVLKGPQGTLFGKDTQAGAINIITKKPDNEIRGKIGAQLGSDNKREYSFNASGPIVKDKFYIGLSGKHYEKDGFITNSYLNKTSDDREHNYGKLNLRWTPTKDLNISLISSKAKYNDGDNRVNGVEAPKDRELSTDIDGYDKSETISTALKVSYNINDYLFESITTQRKFENIGLANYHFPPTSDFHLKKKNIYKKQSQELRLNHSSDRFKWLAGIYADKDDNKYNFTQFFASGTYPTYQELGGDSIGVFLHSDYKLSEKLSFIAGVRYDKDNKDFRDKAMNLNLEKSDGEVTPKIAFKYQKDQDTMLYATVAKGYRSGGFHPYAASGYSKEYEKETLWNYEIGAKTSFFDNRLFLNSSIFYMDIDDMQVSTSPEPGKSYMANAAKSTSKGFELELNAKVTQNLELFASYGYSNVEFDEYKDSSGNYKGNKNPYAPDYNYNIGAQYRDAKGYYARVDLNGYGKTYFDKENKNSRDAYNLVDTKIGFEKDSYEIYLYGKNIFDKKYDSVGAHGGYFTTYSSPREIGVQLTYRF